MSRRSLVKTPRGDEQAQFKAFVAAVVCEVLAQHRPGSPAPPQPDAPPPRAVLTVASYAAEWIESRVRLGMVSAKHDRVRLRLHILPVLGELDIRDVRPRHIRDLVQTLRARGELAPRSIRQVYALLHVMFQNAVADEIIETTPVVLRRGILPANVDKDPEWRQGAHYERDEIAALLTSTHVPHDRRMLYALKFFAALRHTEAATLRWGRIVERKPLRAILLGKTKAKVPRAVPVHPGLAQMLDEWRSGGWPLLFRREPTDADLVVPARGGAVRLWGNTSTQLHRDLGLLGFRRRRGHDLRRSLISLARQDGARVDVLESITHAPRGDIMNLYTHWDWDTQCAELSRLRLPMAAAAPLGLLPTVHRRVEAPDPEHDPATVYLASLGPNSRHAMYWGMAILAGGTPRMYAWERLRPADVAELAATLASKYTTRSAELVLIALRRVLAHAHKLALMTEPDYRATVAPLLLSRRPRTDARLTRAEAAHRLGLTRSGLKSMQKRDRLRAERDADGVFRFDPGAVEALARARAIGPSMRRDGAGRFAPALELNQVGKDGAR